MRIDEMRSRHLVTNEKSNLKLGFRIVGSAYYAVQEKVYTLYMRIFPGIPFYVVPNWCDIPEFIVFSGHSVRDNGKSRYFNRVGSGFIRQSENLLEVILPDLDKTLYIHLDAADWHLLEKAKAS